MARSLGMSTIAEGVETIEQLEFLRARGCDEIQGYHFSRPLPPEAFEQFVRDNLRTPVGQQTHPCHMADEITI